MFFSKRPFLSTVPESWPPCPASITTVNDFSIFGTNAKGHAVAVADGCSGVEEGEKDGSQGKVVPGAVQQA